MHDRGEKAALALQRQKSFGDRERLAQAHKNLSAALATPWDRVRMATTALLRSA
jgi:hypothetical protein